MPVLGVEKTPALAFSVTASKANIETIRQARPLVSSGVLGPGAHLDKIADCSLTSGRLPLQNCSIDAISSVTAQIGTQQRGNLRLQFIARKKNQRHGPFQVLEELWIGRGPGPQLLRGEFKSGTHVAIGRVAGPDEFNKLKAQQRKMKRLVVIENLLTKVRTYFTAER